MPPSKNTESLKTFRCGSWRTKMLVKMKECGDAIKNMITFDKSPITVETARRTMSTIANSTSFSSRSKTSMSSLSDTVTFSSIASKDKDYQDEENSNSNEEKQLNTSSELNDSLNRLLTSNDTTSSSLKSFLMLEKQVMEEYLHEEEAFTIKRKISAEPFLSYAEGTAEFVWADDTENSLSCSVWNSTEHLNFSDINFEHPHINSTFCECSLAKKHRTSSPIRHCDSGFENHFSI